MTEYHYFKADWCGPCSQTTPIAKEKDVRIHDVDAEQETANDYNVRSLPTLVIENGQERERKTGVTEVLATLEEL